MAGSTPSSLPPPPYSSCVTALLLSTDRYTATWLAAGQSACGLVVTLDTQTLQCRLKTLNRPKQSH